ncbi:MAG: EamA family transporter [Deltaproteobacteria bacterium]|nr:EamA family transporter [Deltaproteobacteria bacterium]
MSNRTIAPWKIAYGIASGGVVALAYLFVRLRGQGGGLDLFGIAAAFIFVGHLALWPRLVLRGLRDSRTLVRGALFGVTQVLIFKAQAAGHTSTAIVAATMGSVFGVLLGRMILKEKLQGLAAVAGALCLLATLTNPAVLLVSYWGIAAGIIQGSGAVLARSMMLDRLSIRQSIAGGYLVAALCSGVAIAFDASHFEPARIHLVDVAGTVVIGILAQYCFFYLYKMLDSQRASTLALSRIPWVLAAESVLFGRILPPGQLFSGALVIAGSMLFLVDARVFSRRAATVPDEATTR